MRVRVERAWTVLLTLVGVALCFVPLFDVLGYEWCLAMGVVVASVAWGVWRFYAAPPICGYDPFAGYFAGTLYDEEVTITRAFGWARLYHAAGLLLVLAALADHLDAARLALRLKPRG